MTDLTALLADVKAALQQATPGPWARGSRHGTYCTEITSADGGREIAAVWNYDDAFAPGELRPVQQLSAQGEADFALMQHTPEWLGALVQAVEDQQRRIAELEGEPPLDVEDLARILDWEMRSLRQEETTPENIARAVLPRLGRVCAIPSERAILAAFDVKLTVGQAVSLDSVRRLLEAAYAVDTAAQSSEVAQLRADSQRLRQVIASAKHSLMAPSEYEKLQAALAPPSAE